MGSGCSSQPQVAQENGAKSAAVESQPVKKPQPAYPPQTSDESEANGTDATSGPSSKRQAEAPVVHPVVVPAASPPSTTTTTAAPAPLVVKDAPVSASQPDSTSPASPKPDAGHSVLQVTCIQGRKFVKQDVYLSVKPEGATKPWVTRSMPGTSKPAWNQRFKLLLDTHQKQPGFFTVELYEKGKEKCLGDVTFPLVHVYGQPASLDWCTLRNKDNEVVGEVQLHVLWSAASTTELTVKQREAAAHAEAEWSHLLSVKVEKARNLERQSMLDATDCFVVVSWGDKSAKTEVCPDTENPEWKGAECVFWCDASAQAGYKLAFTLYDKDKFKDNLIGAAYLDASSLLSSEWYLEHGPTGESTSGSGAAAASDPEDAKLNRPPSTHNARWKCNVWLTILPRSDAVAGASDKDLANLSNNLSPTSAQQTPREAKRGELNVTLTLETLESVQEAFFARATKAFAMDSKDQSYLTYAELINMLSTLGLEESLTPQQLMKWIESADENHDGKISRSEISTLLKVMHFSDPTSNFKLSTYIAKHGRLSDTDILLQGVTHAGTEPGQLIVQDRVTGLSVRENIPKYIEMAMKAMFTSGLGRLMSTGDNAVGIMNRLSIKQGKKFDDPASAKEIPHFVALHNLDVNEVEKPLTAYRTMNEFFYRKLKAGARPIDSPEDPFVALSPADCRLMVFQDVLDATTFWIKGDQFSVEGVLGPRGPELAKHYVGGAMAICRLAPQDYHRFHMPCNGVVTRRTKIDGALYTVNPIAINQNVNVYTHNKREVVEIESPEFGNVIFVAVGATMVGSIHMETQYDSLPVAAKKGDSLGWFAFGGSTVLLFFEPGKLQFDEDLQVQSNKRIEMLVKCNSCLGVSLLRPGGAQPVNHNQRPVEMKEEQGAVPLLAPSEPAVHASASEGGPSAKSSAPEIPAGSSTGAAAVSP